MSCQYIYVNAQYDGLLIASSILFVRLIILPLHTFIKAEDWCKVHKMLQVLIQETSVHTKQMELSRSIHRIKYSGDNGERLLLSLIHI